MNSHDIRTLLISNFPHEPTNSQLDLLDKLSFFLTGNGQRSLFVIKGYAGTGKTTIVRSLVNVLPKIKYKSVLLAPTGRAAKVLANYSDRPAYTIHKKIYRMKSNSDGFVSLALIPNLHKETIFIVDEASMIANSQLSGDLSLFSNRSILDDLIEYVFNESNCKLIFIGDTAQLPPVGMDISPALDIKHLTSNYHLNITTVEMTEVVRQKKESGILFNATKLRNFVSTKKNILPKFRLENFADIIRLSGIELEDALNDSFSKYGKEGTAIICRSNKRANIYNQQIRTRIFYQENEIASGDFMMVVKNNYFWLTEESKAGFIANGDTIEVLKIIKTEELYGFRFAKAMVRMPDYPNEPDFETILLLDTILAETPALSSVDNKRFYQEVLQDYSDIPVKRLRMKKVKENPYFNALQVKFSYALTCHKSQGGQWPSVFVEQGYITKEMINIEFLRWLYTALTRSTEKLYLVNFNKDFFE